MTMRSATGDVSPAAILARIRGIQADTAGVMEACRWVEWLLGDRFGAEGMGIHSRVSAVEHLLKPELVQELRYLGSVRNDFAHNPLAEVRNPDRFVSTALRVVERLLEGPDKPAPRVSAAAIGVSTGEVCKESGLGPGLWSVLLIGACLMAAKFLFAEKPVPVPVPADAEVARIDPPARTVPEPAVSTSRPVPAQNASALPARKASAPAPLASAPVEQAPPATVETTEISIEDIRIIKSRL